ncbi:hypothetical protein CO134_00925 [Candidatus Kuenenbacteria bacterium CG_4_9_14_3_um_filter_39_14]|uniref:LysM domain-containing protein n=1 Tax=Candidatus Kuenenbacteria bacterium CG_4_9_14_3_um_filter_39_14 TaxID=1974616 RepID=A0A2M7Z9R4_9BACT|nr:MAG: hypothetical protein CO134_00925 [Candidatus Kuenenbacteria bacterium CG_4_9_14_3_um_filter_39_14]
MPKTLKTIFNGLWQVFFKLLLVPIYKFFLFFKKLAQKYLIHNPYLSAPQIKKTLKQNYSAHLVIALIFIFVLINNLATRETYAEEFNKNSIVAQLLITDTGQEIIERSPSLTNIAELPKTESVINQLAALEIKNKNSGQPDNANQTTDQIALSQGGQALIQPTATPFGNDTNNEDSTAAPARKEIQIYLVQSGDTISGIAKKFGISINTILWENNLSLSSYINPGDKLNILPVTGIAYVIQSGDTLSAIAKKYGTTIEKILASNNLESAGSIKARQKIIIPDGQLGYSAPARTRSIYASSSGALSANNFLWPSNSKRITQYYSWRHLAIDIGAQLGTPIYAARAGRIERAGWSTGYGYNIIINHGGGVKTLYAHASKLYVQHGDQVEQGEIIGAIGSSGWSTGPHVHFEIIINGSKVNPLSYL